MKRIATAVVRTLGLACSVFVVTSVQAATPRAYISVNGNDLNTCNVPTTPCRTYTGGISQTTPGGEVIVLDSGTFGGGTISQSVTINAPAGIVALAATPLVVNPGSGNVVVLRGLTFQSPTPGTGTGITQQSGTLFVENVVVDSWSDGLVSQMAAQGLYVKSSVFRNQSGSGVWVQLNSTQNVGIEDSFFERNLLGLALEGGTGRVSNTVLAGNGYGAFIGFDGPEFTFQRCEVSGNTVAGLYAADATVLRVAGSTITRNATGLVNTGFGAVVESFGNNVIRGNTTNTVGTITPVALQ
jgi:hypothetical protein